MGEDLFVWTILYFWRAHTYHACSAGCDHVSFTFVACSKAKGEEAFLDVSGKGKIETEETPSRKRKQSKVNGMKKKRIF